MTNNLAVCPHIEMAFQREIKGRAEQSSAPTEGLLPKCWRKWPEII